VIWLFYLRLFVMSILKDEISSLTGYNLHRIVSMLDGYILIISF